MANHNDVRLALEIHAAMRPARSVFTHISHEVDHWRQTSAETLLARVEFGTAWRSIFKDGERAGGLSRASGESAISGADPSLACLSR
jgi:hypothetical protein